MELTHRLTLPATRDEAWTAFAHLDRLAPCFPGATITSTDGNEFAGSIKVKLGPIALDYAGTGRVVERDDDRARMVIEASGRDTRGNGTATATVSATFVAAGDQTHVEVHSELSITGKPAQFGRGVISEVSDKLLDQFESCVSGRIADGLGEPDPVTASGSEKTVELSEVPGALEDGEPAAQSGRGGSLHGVDAPPDTDTTTRPTVARRTPEAPTYHYTPPADQSEPDFRVLATVVPPLFKRYWPVLAGAGAAAFVISKLSKGSRR